MHHAQKVLLIGTMILLKAMHVLFVHESTHDPSSEAGSEAVAGQGGKQTEGVSSADDNSDAHAYAYNTVMAVILAEGLKLAISAVIFIRAYCNDEGALLEGANGGAGGLGGARADWASMTRERALSYGLPAAIYMVEDNLRFLVLQQLHTPVTWMIFCHLEIPFVAIMSTTLLGRRFSRVQWVSVVLLLNGVMASQLAVCETRLHEPCNSLGNYPVKGIALVALSALFAASAGIASEFIYKRDLSVSIWLQNCLLYAYAMGLNSLVLLAKQMRPSSAPLWEGFEEGMPWAVVLSMAGMGLCVSAVIKHMSNLAKVFTSALGIFVTAGLSALFQGFELSLPFLLAAGVVVCALYLYVLEKDRVGEQAGHGHTAGAASPKRTKSTMDIPAKATDSATELAPLTKHQA
uniref:CMP-sialic acid transporter n=1 Tax=Tetraselmis chuii TaxID=63592 RepID=A0A7S1X351_9CHLO|mmetsp:Transcript_24143/g.42989  ORF Transcript_24143/g.42989 Transcript_24143/m.42989 type:complete len:405 (+) Transcript_24143:44-1258(+)